MNDTAALLDALDRVREVRGSLAIFDALVADDPRRVAEALRAAPRHPLRSALVDWLAARGVPEPENEGSLAVLARHGITDVDVWVRDTTAREQQLARALEQARAERDLALRSANAYALMTALLAALAIAGWFLALGGLPEPITAPESPSAAPPPG